MSTLTYSHTLVAGTNENVNDVQDMFNDVKTLVNGNLDDTNISSTLASYVGVSQSGSPRRGKSIIATAESRSANTYAVLTTPDRVSGIVHPADGLMEITFSALWKLTSGFVSATHSGSAAIFIGGNQLKVMVEGTAPSGQQATLQDGDANTDGFYKPLGTTSLGLSAPSSTGTGADTTLVTTGMIAGLGAGSTLAAGSTRVWLAAGTYDVEIRYLSVDNTHAITFKDRKLHVVSLAY